MAFPPVDRVCHAFSFVFRKKIADVTVFGLNLRKSLRKTNSLLRYFRAFRLQSGIAAIQPTKKGGENESKEDKEVLNDFCGGC